MVQIHLLSNDNFPNFQTMFQIHVLSNDKNRNLEQEGKHESQIWSYICINENQKTQVKGRRKKLNLLNTFAMKPLQKRELLK